MSQTIFSKQLWPVLLVGMVFSGSLAITYLAWRNAKYEVLLHQQNAFNFQVYEIINQIKYRLDAYEQILRGTSGLFAASVSVEHNEFKAYIESLRLNEKYPGIQSVGVSLIIPKNQPQSRLEKIPLKEPSNYGLHHDNKQEFYTSIAYLDPLPEHTLRSFGYDMYSEPVLRAAMQKARDLNQATISGKIKLSSNLFQNGFLMYLPLYSNPASYPVVSGGQQHVIGWVYAPFLMRDFMDGWNTSLLKKIHLEIFDNTKINPSALMFNSDNIANRCDVLNPYLRQIKHLAIKEHYWTLVMCSTPYLEKTASDKEKPAVIATASGLLSLLLTFISWRLLMGRHHALDLASKMRRKSTESEARFRIMADSAPVLIWITGLDSQYIWFNKAWLKFTGHTLAQELRLNLEQRIHADDLQNYLSCYINHFNRHANFTMEYRLKRHDGQYRWMLDSGVPRFDNTGTFAGFIGSCIDITERKHMEAALQRSTADLTRLAEISAHHLMEPVRRLTSYTQRLAKLLSPVIMATTPEQEIKECLDFLQADAQRLRNRLYAIQHYLAETEPRGPVQLQDVNKILAQIQKRFQAKLCALKVNLTVSELPPVYLDRSRLLDLFSLIIDNALTHGFSEKNSPAPRIVITGERLNKLSRYTITDNGVGIPSEYHERVFEFFERLGHTQTPGAGVGLAIARRIVESRHGKIWIESPPHSGTTVIFELPDGEYENDLRNKRTL